MRVTSGPGRLHASGGMLSASDPDTQSESLPVSHHPSLGNPDPERDTLGDRNPHADPFGDFLSDADGHDNPQRDAVPLANDSAVNHTHAKLDTFGDEDGHTLTQPEPVAVGHAYPDTHADAHADAHALPLAQLHTADRTDPHDPEPGARGI